MNKEIATVAGGCFWCTEAIFRRVKGILSVTPGYAGGTVKNPTYTQVCTGETGHAEAVQIEFDPNRIPYEKVLDIFWNTHNPTILNQQGNDTGTQYRSAIFYHDKKQKEAALRLKKELEKKRVFKKPIVTEVTQFTCFYPAEDYHKNYFDKNAGVPYCDYVISPKIRMLLEKYGDDVKEEFKK